ncbi:MAG: hypothetical protein HZA31_13075 [Opitutae bacterium]|nr:hypothetical protein [Opitutae bacterium]
MPTRPTSAPKRWPIWTCGLLAGAGVAVWFFSRTETPPTPSATAPLQATTPAKRAAAPAGSTGLLSSSNRDDLLAALRQKLAEATTPNEINDLLIQLARLDPKQTMELALQIARDDSERYQFVVNVLRQWAELDLATAWRWAQQTGPSIDQSGFQTLTEEVVQRAAKSRPQEIVAMIEAALLGQGGLKADARLADETIAALLQNGQVDAARSILERWARSNMAESLHNGPFELIALSLSQKSLADAATWLQSLPPSRGQVFGLANLAGIWASQDPAAAVEWSLRLPIQGGRGEALERAFSRWAETDYASATRWITAHEAEPEADHLVSQLLLVSSFAQAHPAESVAWAELIRNDQSYDRAIERILHSWVSKDSATALQYLRNNSRLSAERRQQIELNLSLPKPD